MHPVLEGCTTALALGPVGAAILFLRLYERPSPGLAPPEPTGSLDRIGKPLPEWYLDFVDCDQAQLAPEVEEEDLETAAQLSKVHVAYSSDARGLRGILLSALSLSRSLSNPKDCAIHIFLAAEDLAFATKLLKVLHCELSQDSEWEGHATSQSSQPPPVFLLHRLRTRANIDPQTFATVDKGHKTAQALVRLYFHEYLPATLRVLWLDHDTIVRVDVAALYRTRLHAAPLAAARTLKYHWCPRRSAVALGLLQQLPNETLVNTGVAIFDLAHWRPGVLTSRIEGWLRVTEGCLAEQLAVNLELHAQVRVLDWRWNVQGFGELDRVIKRACATQARILHFTGPGKPWLPAAARNDAFDGADAVAKLRALRPSCEQLLSAAR